MNQTDAPQNYQLKVEIWQVPNETKFSSLCSLQSKQDINTSIRFPKRILDFGVIYSFS